MVKKRFPKLAPTRWNYSSRLLEKVKKNHDDLIQLFEHVTESRQNFDHKSINEAQGFLQSLSSFDLNILLIIYALIFPFTEYLFKIFWSKSNDILFCFCEVENTITKLQVLRANNFCEIWEYRCEQVWSSYSKKSAV